MLIISIRANWLLHNFRQHIQLSLIKSTFIASTLTAMHIKKLSFLNVHIIFLCELTSTQIIMSRSKSGFYYLKEVFT